MKKLGTISYYVRVLLSVPRPYTVQPEDITVLAECHIWDAQGQLVGIPRTDVTAQLTPGELQSAAAWINRVLTLVETE